MNRNGKKRASTSVTSSVIAQVNDAHLSITNGTRQVACEIAMHITRDASNGREKENKEGYVMADKDS